MATQNDEQYDKQLFMNNGGAGLLKLPETFMGIPTAILSKESLKFVAGETRKENQKELEQRVRHEIHKLCHRGIRPLLFVRDFVDEDAERREAAKQQEKKIMDLLAEWKAS